jgi:hypothetical protein
MSRLMVDVLDGIELAEMCEFLDCWLAQCPDAAASYDHHVGVPDASEDLRTALQHLAAVLTIAPVTEADR